MTKENKQQPTTKTADPLRSAVKRLVMLVRGKWRFINYRKEFNGGYPVSGWKPVFARHWMGGVWQLTWRGFAIACDMRTNWLADMVDPNRPNRHEA